MAAKCILPVTQSDVPKSYGTRHRAAIGMSEISDAIIIVVSEETGGISIAQGGELRRNIDPVRLQQTLQRYLTINTRKRSKKRWPSKAGARKSRGAIVSRNGIGQTTVGLRKPGDSSPMTASRTAETGNHGGMTANGGRRPVTAG